MGSQADVLTLIQSQTLGADAASVTFSSIPGTYKTLMLKACARGASTTAAITIQFNGSTSTFTTLYLTGSGSAASSTTTSVGNIGNVPISTDTASTFGNLEIVIPNYAGAANKAYTVDVVTENNATAATAALWTGLWSTTSAITSITLANATNFLAGSTFTLYAIA